jgi:hypothetical protein
VPRAPRHLPLTVLGQLDWIRPGDQRAERPARADLRQLVGVSDPDHLGVNGVGGVEELGKVPRVRHARFVNDKTAVMERRFEASSDPSRVTRCLRHRVLLSHER